MPAYLSNVKPLAEPAPYLSPTSTRTTTPTATTSGVVRRATPAKSSISSPTYSATPAAMSRDSGGYALSAPQTPAYATGTTAKTAPKATPSAGGSSYKGVAIRPGTDAEVAAQVRAIDAGQSAKAPASKTLPSIGLAPRLFAETQAKKKASQQAQPEVPTYAGIVQKLVAQSSGNRQVTDAQDALTKFRNAAATGMAKLNSDDIPLPFQQGRAQVVQQANLQKEAALEQGVANALQAQQQELSAIEAAGRLAAPQLAGYAQQSYNPLTGSFSGGDLSGPVAAVADQVRSGRMTYDQGLSALAGYGQGGTNALNAALGPSFDVYGSNTRTGIRGEQIESQEAYRSAEQQAANLAAQLGDLISTFGLNPNDVNAANAALQKIAQNTSDWRYKALENYVNDVASRYAQVLTPAGGSQTDTTRSIASSMLDSTMSGQGLKNVLATLAQQAEAVIAGVPTVGVGASGGSGFAESWY